MSNLRFSGLLTGIDTTDIVKQLMIVNSQRLSRYKVKKIGYETQNVALDELRTKTEAFQSSVTAISNADNLEAFKVSSSDGDRLGLHASGDAAQGTHTVRINQLATTETWIQDTSTFDYKTDYVGAGNFIYSYNYQERVIAATATTTLEDFVDLINNDEDNPGITASLLKQGEKYHLMLTGKETGEDYQTSINTTNTQVLVATAGLIINGTTDDAELSTKLTELYGFTGTIEATDKITIDGAKNDGTVVDEYFVITANTTVNQLINEINEAFEDASGNRTATATLVNGEIKLTDHTSGNSELQLTLGLEVTGDVEWTTIPSFARTVSSGVTLTSDPGGTKAVGTDKVVDLEEFTGTPDVSDELVISGTDRTGAAVTPSNYGINVNTTIDQIIAEINTVFSGIATASLVDGELILIDSTGAGLTSITLDFNDNGSGASFGTFDTATTFAKTSGGTDGGTVSASISSLTPSTFIETQDAQNAEYRIDGFPPVVAEVQDFAADSATSGNFTLTYGGQTTAIIQWNATAATIQSALEDLSTVNADDITVSGDLTSSGLTFTFANTLGNVGSITINTGTLDPTTFTDGQAATETTQGRYEWTTGNSNTVTDALTGISLFLFDVNDVNTSGDIIDLEVTITRDTSSVTKKVQSMVSAYNSLMAFLINKTEYNTETKKMGTLSRDTTVSLLKSQIKAPFNGVVTGFSSDDTYTQASELGLTLDGYNMLNLDSTILNNILAGDNFIDALDLIGALATGNTDSSTVEFYSASDKYTTAGTYDFQVKIETGDIVFDADTKIKLSSESTWRQLIEVDGVDNIIGGESSTDSNTGEPLFPENSLQLKIDLSVDGTFTGTLRVKKGFAGTLVEMLDDVTKTGGRLDIGDDTNQDYQDAMTLRIENEEERLDDLELRLINKFARLEKILANLQMQMASVAALTATLGA